MCGPRLGRFDEGVSKDIPGHDMAFVTLGTFMLWFGWYGFNTGSVYLYDTPSAEAVQRAAVNTTLGASASGLVALLVASWTSGKSSLCIPGWGWHVEYRCDRCTSKCRPDLHQQLMYSPVVRNSEILCMITLTT